MINNFFYDDKFFYGLVHLVSYLDIGDPNKLQDGWEISVELAHKEPIFKLDIESMSKILYDCNEERFPENQTLALDHQIETAIEQAIDFHKLAVLLPKCYYPSGKLEIVTKKDLIDFFKPVE